MLFLRLKMAKVVRNIQDHLHVVRLVGLVCDSLILGRSELNLLEFRAMSRELLFDLWKLPFPY